MCIAAVMCTLSQCADVFFLKADICQLGMDQRKVRKKEKKRKRDGGGSAVSRTTEPCHEKLIQFYPVRCPPPPLLVWLKVCCNPRLDAAPEDPKGM